jgi:hypothetical protein
MPYFVGGHRISKCQNCNSKYLLTSEAHSKHQHYGRTVIPRVPGASPRAKNRALGEADLPRVLHSGKNCTRGRRAHEKEKLHLTATIDGAV